MKLSKFQLEKIRAVIFDLGNTLALPDWPRISAVLERIVDSSFDESELQVRLSRILSAADRDKGFLREVAEKKVVAGWEFHRLFGELGFEDSRIQELVSAIRTEHENEHLWSKLNPEAMLVLEELKREGIRLAVISNSPDGRVAELLDHLKISRFFEFSVDSNQLGIAKPDPRIFSAAVNQMKIKPQETIYVGDSYEQDVAGAKKAGLLAVLYDPFNLQPGSDVVRISNLWELMSVWKERTDHGQ